MQTLLMILVALAMLATLATLAMGVIGMARGTDPRRANQLMQRRVLLQGVAIGLFVLLLSMLKS
jgi:Hypoxia induced protein conserved region